MMHIQSITYNTHLSDFAPKEGFAVYVGISRRVERGATRCKLVRWLMDRAPYKKRAGSRDTRDSLWSKGNLNLIGG